MRTALAILCLLCLGAMPPLPKAILPTNTVYISATARCTTNGLESEFCNEVIYVTTNPAPVVTLAWAASPSPSVDNYAIYWGLSNRTYLHHETVGNVTQATVRLSIPKTNRVVTITAMQSTTLTGAWTAVTGPPAAVMTNPIWPQFYKLKITEAWQ